MLIIGSLPFPPLILHTANSSNNNNNNNELDLCSTFLPTEVHNVLNILGKHTSSTINVWHPLGYCTATIFCSRTLSLHGGAVRSDICQLGLRVRLGGHDGMGPGGEFSHDTGVNTPYSYKKCHGFFNDHRESGQLFNVHQQDSTLHRAMSHSLPWGIGISLDQREECPLLAL